MLKVSGDQHNILDYIIFVYNHYDMILDMKNGWACDKILDIENINDKNLDEKTIDKQHIVLSKNVNIICKTRVWLNLWWEQMCEPGQDNNFQTIYLVRTKLRTTSYDKIVDDKKCANYANIFGEPNIGDNKLDEDTLRSNIGQAQHMLP